MKFLNYKLSDRNISCYKNFKRKVFTSEKKKKNKKKIFDKYFHEINKSASYLLVLSQDTNLFTSLIVGHQLIYTYMVFIKYKIIKSSNNKL